MKTNKLLLDIKDCKDVSGIQWKAAFREVCSFYGKTMTDVLNEFIREQVETFSKRNEETL